MSGFNSPSTKTSFLYLLSEGGSQKMMEHFINITRGRKNVFKLPPLISFGKVKKNCQKSRKVSVIMGFHIFFLLPPWLMIIFTNITFSQKSDHKGTLADSRSSDNQDFHFWEGGFLPPHLSYSSDPATGAHTGDCPSLSLCFCLNYTS